MRNNQSPATVVLPRPTTAAVDPDRYLLAELNRWARANGWHRNPTGGRTYTHYRHRVTFNKDSVSVWGRNLVTLGWPPWPVTHRVLNVRQGVDILVAAGVLPVDVFGAAEPAGIAVAA